MERHFIEMGQRMKQRRKELHITQIKLAEMTRTSNNHISSIENGREKPSLDLLMNICESLQTTPDYLLLGNIHSNNIPQNIIDSLRLCNEPYISLAQDIVALLVKYSK